MRKPLQALIVLLAMSASAHAESPPEKLKEARRMVELMDYKSMFDTYLTQCKKSENSLFDPIMVFKRNPGAFMGVSPQSVYWPEIEAVYQQYQNRVCEYFSADAFTDFFAQELASRLSLEDLRASIAFQSSAVGKRLQEASIVADANFQAQAQANLLAVTAEADKATQSALATIFEKYKKLPK